MHSLQIQIGISIILEKYEAVFMHTTNKSRSWSARLVAGSGTTQTNGRDYEVIERDRA